MKDKILEIYNKVGKRHYAKSISKEPELVSWIYNQTSQYDILTLPERIAVIIKNHNPICEISSNKKRFINFEEGFGFCGMTNKCQCAKESVSKNVAETKAKYTNERRKEIQYKKETTNIQKYGVKNQGQREETKKRHREFYSDHKNVLSQIEKQKETLLKKHGVTNAAHMEKSIERMTVDNPMKNELIKQKSIKNRQKLFSDNPRIYIEQSYYKLKEQFKDNYNVDWLTKLPDYNGVTDNEYHNFKCLNCGNIFDTWINNGHDIFCPFCHVKEKKKDKSLEEKELYDWVLSLGLVAQRGNKSLIKPLELDIWIPALNTAIEYCGHYYHCEFSSGKPKNYHKNKLEMCRKQGIELITIFSDEWLQKKEIVKKILTHKLGKVTDKIYARKCEIALINKKEEKAFLEEHHLQGYIPSSICLGLKYNNILVSIMSFGSNRKGLNRLSNDGEFEIRRFATKNVIGSASKLFKSFLKQYNPKSVYSDCDLRWSSGEIYKTLGMDEISESKENYWYVKGFSDRVHRLGFTKSKLSKMTGDVFSTEIEMARNIGLDRIWDCGIKRFKYTR